jgi:SAM-dependent methyltransferase
MTRLAPALKAQIGERRSELTRVLSRRAALTQPRPAIERSLMDEAAPNGVDVTRLGVELRYHCELARLGELGPLFIPGQLDAEGEAFLAAAVKRNHSRFGLWAHRALTLVLSDFDANALLGMYPVFLLSTPQAQRLLGAARPGVISHGRLLDIGAGSGDVTTRLAPLVDSVQCTETSRHMARRLRKRGFPCWLGRVGSGRVMDSGDATSGARAEGGRDANAGEGGDPLASDGPFDVIALCNVIDRCDRPRALLSAVARSLPQGGLLLLATPLPYSPFFYAGSLTRDPSEKLKIESDTFEDAVLELYRNELAPLGLELRALTRLPYLSGGDAQYPAYVLDDAVLVCVKR